MAQAAATAKAVVGVNMQPHGVRRIARFPALRAELECAGLLDGDPFGHCLQVGFGDVQSISQPAPGLGFEQRRMAVLYFPNALGMDAGLCGHCPLAHAEG